MSQRNTLRNKLIRRVARRRHKAALASNPPMPFLGIWVTKTMVKGQRYLKENGFPFSKTVANVVITSIFKRSRRDAAGV